MADQLTLFKQYESEYCNKSTEVARKIDGLANLVGDQRRRKVTELEYDLREAEQIIKRMEMEGRSFAPDQAQQVQGKIRDYKSDLQNLKNSLKGASHRSAAGGQSARKDLGLGSEYFSTDSNQRETLLKTTEQANRSTERLQEGRRMLAESEEIGVNILRDLSDQRQTIIRATETLHGAGENVGSARKILNSMSRRITSNKVTLSVIAILLLIAIILIVYFKIAS